MAERWAVVLGASSGFGAATAIALAKAGHHVAGVHLDRKATLERAEAVERAVRAAGREALFLNGNAADEERRAEFVKAIQQALARQSSQARVHVLLHSLAFGALKPFVGAEALSRPQMEMTLEVMANSLVWWTRDLLGLGLLARPAHVFAMTSEGAGLVWPSYGAVSAAKAALEAHVRQLAVELAPQEVTVNAIRAGVTDTPAARRIPGFEQLKALALRKNPHRRLTEPGDVADCIVALARPETRWMTGNVLGVDGGEHLAG